MKDNQKVYSLGEIVYNEYVIKRLEEKCLIVTKDINTILRKAKVIIRAHGEEIAKKVNKMIIVSGKNSFNTEELVNISLNHCKNVYLIKKNADLVDYSFQKNDNVGISSGASTPNELINDVVNYLENLSF